LINNPQAASIAKLIREIAQQTGAATLNVSATSNSIAAEMANFVPGPCSPKIITELFDANNLSAIHFATSSTLIVLRYSGISAPERSKIDFNTSAKMTTVRSIVCVKQS
jgi:hypothetical protein